MDNKILDFYKQTSLYTDLGLYKDFMNAPKRVIKDISNIQEYL